MVNNNAIRFLDFYIQQTSGNFAEGEAAYATNVEVCIFLKSELQKGSIMNNRLFQWAFVAFYGMRVVPEHGKLAFFERMEGLRNNHSDLNAREVTEGLAPLMCKNYFSFVTKMLNLLDDTSYPIYDSKVANVFQRPFAPDESHLDHQCLIYQDIIDTYRQLEEHPAIELFKTHFNCPQLGYMKILDSIFWRLGRMKEDNGDEFPWQ